MFCILYDELLSKFLLFRIHYLNGVPCTWILRELFDPVGTIKSIRLVSTPAQRSRALIPLWKYSLRDKVGISTLQGSAWTQDAQRWRAKIRGKNQQQRYIGNTTHPRGSAVHLFRRYESQMQQIAVSSLSILVQFFHISSSRDGRNVRFIHDSFTLILKERVPRVDGPVTKLAGRKISGQTLKVVQMVP